MLRAAGGAWLGGDPAADSTALASEFNAERGGFQRVKRAGNSCSAGGQTVEGSRCINTYTCVYTPTYIHTHQHALNLCSISGYRFSMISWCPVMIH